MPQGPKFWEHQIKIPLDDVNPDELIAANARITEALEDLVEQSEGAANWSTFRTDHFTSHLILGDQMLIRARVSAL